MKRINTFKVLALCLLLPVLLTSCYRPGTLGASGHYEVYELGKIAIPVFSGLSGDEASRFDEATLLETDSYGRSLYSYRCLGYCEYLILCQMYIENTEYDFRVYWYDDCWRCKDDNAGGFSFEEIKELKAANDWGNPLDTSKMNDAQILCWSSSLSQEEKNRYESYAASLRARNEAAEAAACALYGEETKIRYLVGKNGLYFTLAHLPDKSARLICFDPVSKSIISDRNYAGADADCHDEFMNFMGLMTAGIETE